MKDQKHFYVRVIGEHEEDPVTEFKRVEEVARATPGVTVMKPPERHPRGGYRLFFTVPARAESNVYDRMFQHLFDHGFRPCF